MRTISARITIPNTVYCALDEVAAAPPLQRDADWRGRHVENSASLYIVITETALEVPELVCVVEDGLPPVRFPDGRSLV